MTLYVIEKRHPNGSLDFSDPQPERYFGNRAITGINDNAMARVVFALAPLAVLTGDAISKWPSIIDPNFVARIKTW